MKTLEPKFGLGQIVITPGAMDSLDATDVQAALELHASGDWGQVDREDWQSNNRALEDGDRLLSAYKSQGERFWIITEWDRSVTTILLPEEY